jgi:hypothetical protein
MFGARRISSLALVAKRVQRVASPSTSTVATRSFVSTGRAAGAHAKDDSHGHDDHHDEHHAHPMWEDLPFGKYTSAAIVFGGAFTGVSIIVGACTFQNKKHGFPQK